MVVVEIDLKGMDMAATPPRKKAPTGRASTKKAPTKKNDLPSTKVSSTKSTGPSTTGGTVPYRVPKLDPNAPWMPKPTGDMMLDAANRAKAWEKRYPSKNSPPPKKK